MGLEALDALYFVGGNVEGEDVVLCDVSNNGGEELFGVMEYVRAVSDSPHKTPETIEHMERDNLEGDEE